jgi:nanoRNase/pAp phosphatase (c-di-AMP/oligoRNAs hydrolase)
VELSPKQQINDLVKKSEKILVLSHAALGGDAVGGMLALGRVLTKLGKEVSVVASNEIDETLTGSRR